MKLTLEFENTFELDLIACVYKLISAQREHTVLKGENGDHILERIITILSIIDGVVTGPINEGNGDFYTIGETTVDFAEGIATILAIKKFFPNYEDEFSKLDDYLKKN